MEVNAGARDPLGRDMSAAGALNSQRAAAVEGWVRRLLCMTGIALGALATEACIEVDGGAVELSWSLRTFQGEPIASCGDANIGMIRLLWRASDGSSDDPTADGFEDFACPANRGVTNFDISAGPQLLWVRPVCAGGVPAADSTYEVPPPILRYVRSGEVVTLDSLLVVVDDSSQGCTRPTGCTCAGKTGGGR